jgi:hypothetical protein
MSSLAGVALPDDLEWPDEWSWSPVSQAVSVSIGGSLIVEEQAQLAGRPMMEYVAVLWLLLLAEDTRYFGDFNGMVY